MRKLVESTFVTLDGVISSPQEWSPPYWDDEHATGELDRTLMEHNLVDEFHFWLFPVAAGSGQRLFDGIDLTHLNLVDTTKFSSGIVVLTYAPKV